MSRRTLIAIAGTVAVLALAAAVLFLPDYLERAEARRAIAAYNTALTRALYDVNPELLAQYAHDREMGRVRSYFTELTGRGVFMEADLLALDIESVTSEGTTITATTTERWRYVERDSATTRPLGEPIEEEQELVYTLVPRDGDLVVYLSRLRQENP
ncbi:MAG: hypothetical protein CVT60_06565 [Actinobacteria bacterium HGW-Actinobacteria-10]|jgi:hypothetical protein|nr:MAG: hypothetical protein CVT60_06565 [Actinobacteria bacterium HGW-Actinobacteria-10]